MKEIREKRSTHKNVKIFRFKSAIELKVYYTKFFHFIIFWILQRGGIHIIIILFAEIRQVTGSIHPDIIGIYLFLSKTQYVLRSLFQKQKNMSLNEEKINTSSFFK